MAIRRALFNFTYLLALLGVGILGCSPAKVTSTQTKVSPIFKDGPPEPTYCSLSLAKAYSSPVTISGSATFQARPYYTGVGTIGLGAIGSAQAIRYAEVAVLDSNGSLAQCAETDASGNFSFDLPSTGLSYTIRIYARADNSQVKIAILNSPESNVPYSIETAVVADSTKSVGTINADAVNSGTLMGAAFNIYNQILTANEFLRNQASNCSSSFTNCVNFTVAPKVSVYWEKGFNPNSYFGSSSGLSFYLPGYYRLFILGGIDGDIFTSDTDHFDNSVILHEYGHFLEDVYTKTDSPGGSHSGNSVIDPRLAWGEGWGNFIQAAIRNEPHYRDTQGTPNATNPTTASNYIFNISTETETTASGSCSVGSPYSGCDVPEFAYEGNFREFSVTRLLWDVFDSSGGGNDADGDIVQNDFKEVWAAITATADGFKNSSAAFRNVGLLHYIQNTLLIGESGHSSWSSLTTAHSQGDSLEYARYVTRSGGCGKVYSLNPYNDPNDNGSFATSHLLRNNDFYYYHHTGGSFSLSLKALTQDVSGGYSTELEPDLDLYLYNTSARYGDSTDIINSSENYWDNNPTTEQTESFSMSNLAAGNYLINVKVFTGRYLLDNNTATNNCIGTGFRRICENDPAPDYNYVPAGDDTDYELIANGVNLCPANPF